MIVLTYEHTIVPLKCGHPYNQDTSLVPKGVRIIEGPLYDISVASSSLTGSFFQRLFSLNF